MLSITMKGTLERFWTPAVRSTATALAPVYAPVQGITVPATGLVLAGTGTSLLATCDPPG